MYLGGPGYGESLLAMTGLLGISMCLILASLWLRIVQRRGGEVWLFRVQRGEAGKFITPHYVYSVLFLSAIFIICESGSLFADDSDFDRQSRFSRRTRRGGLPPSGVICPSSSSGKGSKSFRYVSLSRSTLQLAIVQLEGVGSSER